MFSNAIPTHGNPGFVLQMTNNWNPGNVATMNGMAMIKRAGTTNGTFTISFYVFGRAPKISHFNVIAGQE